MSTFFCVCCNHNDQLDAFCRANRFFRVHVVFQFAVPLCRASRFPGRVVFLFAFLSITRVDFLSRKWVFLCASRLSICCSFLSRTSVFCPSRLSACCSSLSRASIFCRANRFFCVQIVFQFDVCYSASRESAFCVRVVFLFTCPFCRASLFSVAVFLCANRLSMCCSSLSHDLFFSVSDSSLRLLLLSVVRVVFLLCELVISQFAVRACRFSVSESSSVCISFLLRESVSCRVNRFFRVHVVFQFAVPLRRASRFPLCVGATYHWSPRGIGWKSQTSNCC